MTTKPLAVSLGDPAGVGLEICETAWRARDGAGRPFVLFADEGVASRLRAPMAKIDDLTEAGGAFGRALPVMTLPFEALGRPGAPIGADASLIVGSIAAAVAAAKRGEAAGIVTLPIAKALLYEAGFAFPGHTEFVAHLCKDTSMDGARGPVMMLASDNLRVSLATIHEPLARVPELLTAERIRHVALVTLQALNRDFAVARPRLAVAGLNPHAGEGGALGREDGERIAPAIEALRRDGWEVTGPHPADTLFHAEARARYDAALAMYHDQGLIPLKTLDFWGGVNVTLGLPIVRTSPDHGVGYDIAGNGLARADSFIAALTLAGRMADARAAASR